MGARARTTSALLIMVHAAAARVFCPKLKHPGLLFIKPSLLLRAYGLLCCIDRFLGSCFKEAVSSHFQNQLGGNGSVDPDDASMLTGLFVANVGSRNAAMCKLCSKCQTYANLSMHCMSQTGKHLHKVHGALHLMALHCFFGPATVCRILSAW